MKQFLSYFLAGLIVPSAAIATSDVELADCRLTPEVKKELQLTSQQEPKVVKAFADLSQVREQIEQSRRKRDALRATGAAAGEIDQQQKHLIAVEKQCRERLHRALKPLLTDGQFQKVLEMEEVHHKKIRQRTPTPR